VTLTDHERTRLRVCSAILTRNRRELEWAVTQSEDVVGVGLIGRAHQVLNLAPTPGSHGLVNMTNYLPAWTQYAGQRAILLFPRIAHRLLRSSGLHHQMF
jgi:hypothetical protein